MSLAVAFGRRGGQTHRGAIDDQRGRDRREHRPERSRPDEGEPRPADRQLRSGERDGERLAGILTEPYEMETWMTAPRDGPKGPATASARRPARGRRTWNQTTGEPEPTKRF